MERRFPCMVLKLLRQGRPSREGGWARGSDRGRVNLKEGDKKRDGTDKALLTS